MTEKAILNKKTDENYVQYIVSDVRDADNGYCVYFEDSPKVADPSDVKKLRLVQLTYWLPKSYAFVPKPGDIGRFYGELGLANQGVYGLDFVREAIDEDTGKSRRTRYEMFYKPEDAEKVKLAKVEPAADSKDTEIAKLKKQVEDLKKGSTNTKSAPKKKAPAKKAPAAPAI